MTHIPILETFSVIQKILKILIQNSLPEIFPENKQLPQSPMEITDQQPLFESGFSGNIPRKQATPSISDGNYGPAAIGFEAGFSGFIGLSITFPVWEGAYYNRMTSFTLFLTGLHFGTCSNFLNQDLQDFQD